MSYRRSCNHVASSLRGCYVSGVCFAFQPDTCVFVFLERIRLRSRRHHPKRPKQQSCSPQGTKTPSATNQTNQWTAAWLPGQLLRWGSTNMGSRRLDRPSFSTLLSRVATPKCVIGGLGDPPAAGQPLVVARQRPGRFLTLMLHMLASVGAV